MRADLSDNKEQSRFEIHVDGELAGQLEYRLARGLRILPHTEIDERFEGRGLAGQLVAFALSTARAEGEHVMPLCPFVRKYLHEHPEEIDLVRDVDRASYGLA
jgi:predicted GNAT family acetyltransferase